MRLTSVIYLILLSWINIEIIFCSSLHHVHLAILYRFQSASIFAVATSCTYINKSVRHQTRRSPLALLVISIIHLNDLV